MDSTVRLRPAFRAPIVGARSRALAFALSLAMTAIALPATGVFANPCDDADRNSNFEFGDGRYGVTVQEDFQKSIPAPRGAWRVQGGDLGAIALKGTTSKEVFVCATIYAWAGNREAALKLASQVRVLADERGVRSEGPPQAKRARWGVAYQIFVPRETDVEVRTVNGPISVEGVRSHMDLETVNGPISIVKSGGDVRGRTTNGPLDVTLDGPRWIGRGLDLESTNGPVTVVVPENFSADLEFGTSNGPMEFDFPITVQGRVTKVIKTTLGSGGPPIRVYTVNGPASLQRE